MRPGKASYAFNWKVIAIVATVFLGAGASYVIGKKFMSPTHSSKARAIVAVLSGSLDLPLAPENISTIPLYHVHTNLWDTLLAEHGKPALAKLIKTDERGRVLHFELVPGVRFSNGREITSGDVIFSVHRLMGRQPGGHFNAKSAIEKIEEISPSRFDITLKEPTPSFLFLLSIPEMGIVPKEACDSEGNIRDLSVTSGAYALVGKPAEDSISLLKNRYFLRHDPRSPEGVTVLFKSTAEEISTAVTRDRADFVEVYNAAGFEVYERLKGEPEFSRKITRPSFSAFGVTNPDRLTRSQRLSISKLLAVHLGHFYKPASELEQTSFEILPPETFGSLGRKQPPVVNDATDLPKKLSIATMSPKAPLVQAVVSVLEKAGVKVEIDPSSDDIASHDLVLRGQGMNADYPEIELYLAMLSSWASIPASDVEKSLVLKTIHTDDERERSEAIQRIGRALVDEGRVIPLFVRSYAHIYRKERLNVDQMTTYDGDVPFWKMRVD